MQITFEEYYKKFNFQEFPFQRANAEAEKEQLDSYYVEPINYSIIVNGLKTSSAIVSGERGTGKTALSYKLVKNLKSSDANLVIYITDFASLPLNYTSDDLYKFLIKQISSSFFFNLVSNSTLLWDYSKVDRIKLSRFKNEYTLSSTYKQLSEEIAKIQHHFIKRHSINTFNFFRGILNYGLKAAIQILSDSVSRHFAALPPPEISNEYFKKLNYEIDTGFIQDPQRSSFDDLKEICTLINKSKFKNIYLVLDKIDEDNRLDNDIEKISTFIKPIAQDNRLLINEVNLYTLLFTWSPPFNHIKSEIRTQKLTTETLSWDTTQLKSILEKRLESNSNNKTKISDLFDCTNEKIKLILEMSNNNPRDLWKIIYEIFKQQFKINPNSKLTDNAITEGIDSFVKEFNYYEYYPKKSNARKDSMDIYKYFNHLIQINNLKEDDFKFTKNQLSKDAKTSGTSANNYVVGMERINLIKLVPEKKQGGSLYQVVDPKIKYAIANNLELQSS